MAHYYCGFKVTERTELSEEAVKAQLLQLLKKKELIGWLFDDDLSAYSDVEEDSIREEMQEISLEMPDVLIWVDIYVDTVRIEREYYLAGNYQTVDAIISFPDPDDDPNSWYI